MSTTVTAAVGTDTYGGLSGYKRDLQGNPTRVPSNLPAFRGRPNKPGAEVRAPPIKSSANHPDRKTNVTIPYSRLSHIDNVREPGSRRPGDVVFVSRSRPNMRQGALTTSGQAQFHFARLAGVDQLNHMLSEAFWTQKVTTAEIDPATGGLLQRYANILVDPVFPVDEWRGVPTLADWVVDGVVLSDDQPGAFSGSGERDGQLFNIAVQGPCAINNGYVDTSGNGVSSRTVPVLRAPGYLDQRVERLRRDGGVLVEWPGRPNDAGAGGDIATALQELHPYEYTKQMFTREPAPLEELFVGLVATVHHNPLRTFVDAENNELTLEPELRAYDAAQAGLQRAQEALLTVKRTALQAGDALAELRAEEKDVAADLDLTERRIEQARKDKDKRVLQEQSAQKVRIEARKAGRAAGGRRRTRRRRRRRPARARPSAPRKRRSTRSCAAWHARREADADGAMAQLEKAARTQAAVKDARLPAHGRWEDDDDGGPGRVKADAGAPQCCYVSYQYVSFTSAQAMEINADAGILGIRPYVPVGSVDATKVAPGELHAAKRRRVEHDVYDHFGAVDPHERWKKSQALRRIVGAWRIGKVLDTKAAEMPGYEGGRERGTVSRPCAEQGPARAAPTRRIFPAGWRSPTTTAAEVERASREIDVLVDERQKIQEAGVTASRAVEAVANVVKNLKLEQSLLVEEGKDEEAEKLGSRIEQEEARLPPLQEKVAALVAEFNDKYTAIMALSDQIGQARSTALRSITATHAHQIGELARDGIDSVLVRTVNRGYNVGAPWLVATAGTTTEFDRYGERYGTLPKNDLEVLTLLKADEQDPEATRDALRELVERKKTQNAEGNAALFPNQLFTGDVHDAPVRLGHDGAFISQYANAVRTAGASSAMFDSGRVLQWPTRYDSRMARTAGGDDLATNAAWAVGARRDGGTGAAVKDTSKTGVLAQMDTNTNVPIDPDEFYKGIANPDVAANEPDADEDVVIVRYEIEEKAPADGKTANYVLGSTGATRNEPVFSGGQLVSQAPLPEFDTTFQMVRQGPLASPAHPQPTDYAYPYGPRQRRWYGQALEVAATSTTAVLGKIADRAGTLRLPPIGAKAPGARSALEEAIALRARAGAGGGAGARAAGPRAARAARAPRRRWRWSRAGDGAAAPMEVDASAAAAPRRRRCRRRLRPSPRARHRIPPRTRLRRARARVSGRRRRRRRRRPRRP